jgi:hypothetical protein
MPTNKQIEKYQKLFLSNRDNGAKIDDKFYEMYTKTLAIRRIQIDDLEKACLR